MLLLAPAKVIPSDVKLMAPPEAFNVMVPADKSIVPEAALVVRAMLTLSPLIAEIFVFKPR